MQCWWLVGKKSSAGIGNVDGDGDLLSKGSEGVGNVDGDGAVQNIAYAAGSTELDFS